MLTNPRIGPGWRAALVVLGGWLFAGVEAFAQQPLFPNMTASQRQRVAPYNENPLYKMYRQQYYGYYPTCWRQFPSGWGCPSAELPNSAAVMAEIQRDIKEREEEEQRESPGGGNDRLPGAKPAGPAPIVPLPEEGLSPFDMPPEPANPAGGNAAEPGHPAARLPRIGTPIVSNPEARIRFPDRDHPPSELVSPPPIDLGSLPPPETTDFDSAFQDEGSASNRRSLLGGLLDTVRGRLR